MKTATCERFALLAALTMGAVSTSVHAASWRTCNGEEQIWKNDWTNMYLSTTSMPIGGVWDLHTQYMMSEWNAVKGSNFKFYVGRDTDGSHSKTNGKNEVYFKTNNNDTYLGVTFSRWTCYWLFGTQYGYDEADVELNTRYSWTSSDFTGSNTGSPYNFELVMLHELGHALGLLHSDGKLATMNTYYFNSGPNGHYNAVEPHGDDRYGLRVLYADSSSGNDVSASRFNNTGGGSSTKNRVYTTSGSPTTSLAKGSYYDIEYTMENLGTLSKSVNVKFYLSTNSYISTGDTYLGSSTWNMPAGSNVEAKKRVYLSTSLPTGTYYIGYSVDPDNAIPETDESNNFVSLLNTVYVH